MTVMAIKEKDLFVCWMRTKKDTELPDGLEPSVSVHIPAWCCMKNPVQREMKEQVRAHLCSLMHHYWMHKTNAIGLGEEKECDPKRSTLTYLDLSDLIYR